MRSHTAARTTKILVLMLSMVAATGIFFIADAAQLAVPNTFTAGTTISSAAMNANFTAIGTAANDTDARLTALEAAIAGRKSFYAGQGNVDANASTDDVWVDVSGVSIPVTLTATTSIRYQLFARIYNYGAGAGTSTDCSVRIVQDDAGTPLNPVSPATMGDWNGILTGGASTPTNSRDVALGGLISLPTGTYNFKVQVARQTDANTTNSGNCSIFRWAFSRAQLFVDLVP